jgi:hypothetical protein
VVHAIPDRYKDIVLLQYLLAILEVLRKFSHILCQIVYVMSWFVKVFLRLFLVIMFFGFVEFVCSWLIYLMAISYYHLVFI